MNHSKKLSSFLTKENARSILQAADHAFYRSCPLNQFTSINLDQARVTAPHKFLGRYLKLHGDWFPARFHRTWIYVLENPLDTGMNTHIFSHVPKEIMSRCGAKDFEARQRVWMERAGARMVPGVFDARPIGGNYWLPYSDPFEYIRQLEGAVKYTVKGGDEKVEAWLGCRRKDQGWILGPRFRTSLNIGWKSRSTPIQYSGFQRKLTRPLLFAAYRRDE